MCRRRIRQRRRRNEMHTFSDCIFKCIPFPLFIFVFRTPVNAHENVHCHLNHASLTSFTDSKIKMYKMEYKPIKSCVHLDRSSWRVCRALAVHLHMRWAPELGRVEWEPNEYNIEQCTSKLAELPQALPTAPSSIDGPWNITLFTIIFCARAHTRMQLYDWANLVPIRHWQQPIYQWNTKSHSLLVVCCAEKMQ